ncbi:major capsid protein [Streptomyces phage Dagobah]|nr:major capsid protein [Streptomyces phage Dagobah]
MPKIAIPETQSELEELLSDGTKVQNLMTEGQFPEVVKAYAKHVADTDVDLQRQVKEETQRVLAEYLRENEDVKGLEALKRGGVEAVAKSSRNALYNAKAVGAQIDETQFDGLSGYLKDIWHNTYRTAEVEAKLTGLKNAAFSSGEPASGGFLVPESFRAELLRLSLETGVTRSRARVIPMETARVLFPMLDVTSHADNVYGGISGQWTPESGQMEPEAATFGRIALDAWKLTSFANVPNELIQDSPMAFEAFIRASFPEALSYFEDVAFISGNGAGQPLGWLNAEATVTVDEESVSGGGQGEDTILWENIVKMYSRMLPQSLSRAVWVVSPDVFPQLATMALSVGTGGSAIWLNNGVSGPPATILGRPVVITEKVKQLGQKGDISFVDLGYYLIGDRQAMTVDSSPHFRFQNGETSFRFVTRVDGRPWLKSALTPHNGGPTLSPFVQLATRTAVGA